MSTRWPLSATLVIATCLASAACVELGTEPDETGSARIDFVTYPGETEPGNVAIFAMTGSLPSPCHDLVGADASLDDGRVLLSALWQRTGDDPCTAVVEPFEVTVTVEVPTGFDHLAVTVADSVWDRIDVRADAPGFKKAAGELGTVGEVDDAPGCHRGRVGVGDRVVLLAEPLKLTSPFVVGRLENGVPEACRDAELENVLGTLDVETAY